MSATTERMPTRWKKLLLWATHACVGIAAIAIAWLEGAGTLDMREGTTNGAFNAYFAWMVLLPLGLLLGILFLGIAIVRMFWASPSERAVLGAVIVAVAMLWLFGQRVDRTNAYIRGLSQWASTISPSAVRSWALGAGLSNATPTPPPDWWFVTAPEQPLGVSASPGAVRNLITGPLPDEVRVFPATGRVIMAWGFTGSWIRYIHISAPGVTGPPTEFDRTDWYRVSDDVWIGLREMH